MRLVPSVCLGLLVAVVAACDSDPLEPDALVVQAYFQPNKPLPTVSLSRSVPLNEDGIGRPARGAEIRVTVDGMEVEYGESPEAGVYSAVSTGLVAAGATFELVASHGGDVATAKGTVPPPLTVDSLRVSAPNQPIRAVLLDSLSLPLDSLALSSTGFIYPVDVTLWWTAPPEGAQGSGDYWVETSVTPLESFSSRLIDFFLPSSSVLQEPPHGQGPLSWTGIYAVPVESATTPLPPHVLRVAAVRGELDYARFALSRNDPDRREPVSNVTGGIGIVAGIALDSIRVYVE
ncbi:MAG: hypothetical protein ACI9W4_001396 [Rhodothermales bacterium]|jgi:hypothetical protein